MYIQCKTSSRNWNKHYYKSCLDATVQKLQKLYTLQKLIHACSKFVPCLHPKHQLSYPNKIDLRITRFHAIRPRLLVKQMVPFPGHCYLLKMNLSIEPYRKTMRMYNQSKDEKRIKVLNYTTSKRRINLRSFKGSSPGSMII